MDVSAISPIDFSAVNRGFLGGKIGIYCKIRAPAAVLTAAQVWQSRGQIIMAHLLCNEWEVISALHVKIKR